MTIDYINISDSAVGTDTIVDITEWLTVTDSSIGTDIVYLQGDIQIHGVAPPDVQRFRIADSTVISSKPEPGSLPTRTYLVKQGRTVEIEAWTESLSTLLWLTGLANGAAHDIQPPTGARISVHILQAEPRRSAENYTIRDHMIRAVERMD